MIYVALPLHEQFDLENCIVVPFCYPANQQPKAHYDVWIVFSIKVVLVQNAETWRWAPFIKGFITFCLSQALLNSINCRLRQQSKRKRLFSLCKKKEKEKNAEIVSNLFKNVFPTTLIFPARMSILLQVIKFFNSIFQFPFYECI